MREICTSGSVGGEDGDILTYPAARDGAYPRIALRSMRATDCTAPDIPARLPPYVNQCHPEAFACRQDARG
jgi:hypothetical protein